MFFFFFSLFFCALFQDVYIAYNKTYFSSFIYYMSWIFFVLVSTFSFLGTIQDIRDKFVPEVDQKKKRVVSVMSNQDKSIMDNVIWSSSREKSKNDTFHLTIWYAHDMSMLTKTNVYSCLTPFTLLFQWIIDNRVHQSFIFIFFSLSYRRDDIIKIFDRCKVQICYFFNALVYLRMKNWVEFVDKYDSYCEHGNVLYQDFQCHYLFCNDSIINHIIFRKTQAKWETKCKKFHCKFYFF